MADENAVRLMSIHQSKGLEFPVVAVADLAKPFNTRDAHGEIIFDEKLGLCAKVKPPHTNRRYPSLPHWLAQRHQRREQAGEEQRLLYVAMTRARETLILTGSITKNKWETLWADAGMVTTPRILSAKSYADWIGLWFAQQPGASPQKQGELTHLRWRIVDDTELAGAEKSEIRNPKSEVELPELDDEISQKLQERLAWQYGFAAATTRAAKSSVTALRRQAAEELDDEAEPVFNFQFLTQQGSQNRKSKIENRKLNAADTGTAYHKFFQYVTLKNAGEMAALATEADRLEREKVLSAEERGVLDLDAIAAFWNSDMGQEIQQQSENVKRELSFTAKFSPAELSEIVGTKSEAELEREFVVVQGMADLVVLLPDEIWLVDFKTDAVRPSDLPEKIKTYAPQLKLYARALAKVYSRPVTHCWLHFLAVSKTLDMNI